MYKILKFYNLIQVLIVKATFNNQNDVEKVELFGK